jgi:hypothetical protein
MSYPEGLPEQTNSTDCGVFLLLFAHHQTFYEGEDFGRGDQERLDRSREIFGCDILRGKLGDITPSRSGGAQRASSNHRDGEKPTYRSFMIATQPDNKGGDAPHKLCVSAAQKSYRKVEIDGRTPEHMEMAIFDTGATESTGGARTPKSKMPHLGGKMTLSPSLLNTIEARPRPMLTINIEDLARSALVEINTYLHV